LGEWLRFFALPSVLAIAITFAAVFLLFRRGMQSAVAPLHDRQQLGVKGWIVLCGAAATVLVLMTASVFHWPLGRCTLACALVIVAVVSPFDRDAFAACVKHVSWSTLAFVAGLFVLVAALDSTGVLSAVRGALLSLRAWPDPAALMAAGAAITVVANVANNLPAGVLAGAATAALPAHDALRQGVAIAIDLAPNLSVTGSLATLLWLNALRREGIEMDAWTFLRVGAVVMPAALVPALLSLLLTNR
jgi:arsenical pump membrane protein